MCQSWNFLLSFRELRLCGPVQGTTNQPSKKQASKQAAIQPTNQPTNQTKQTTNLPINQPANQEREGWGNLRVNHSCCCRFLCRVANWGQAFRWAPTLFFALAELWTLVIWKSLQIFSFLKIHPKVSCQPALQLSFLLIFWKLGLRSSWYLWSHLPFTPSFYQGCSLLDKFKEESDFSLPLDCWLIPIVLSSM